MLQYKKIEIFTSEQARWEGRPLYDAVIQFVHDLKIAARCLVTRGIEGSYETGEIATGRLEVLSYNMPLQITIIAPAVEADKIISRVEVMVTDGIVAWEDLNVISHKTHGFLIPKATRVRDIMTRQPKKVSTETPLDEVARLLLSSTFTGVPVVDQANRPVGVISQGDLIYKAGLPVRLGLLAESDQQNVSLVLEKLAPKKAKEVMNQPAVTIEQDKLVTDAVNLMLKKQVKRLPVTDADGKLAGILSRLDVFHTILRECPDWRAFQKQQITVNLRFVSDIMRRDTMTVLPDTPIEEVIRLIDCNDIQRVSVVDNEGRFLGLISDRDLLGAFSNRTAGLWNYLMSRISSPGRERLGEDLRYKTAGEIMNTKIFTVQEDAPIDEAIRLMLDKAIKRLPVVDAQGKFKGMISRDALLRAGFIS
uniref:CBS domain-containing protein n=1 Tax=Desulfobacca acetoxidans TaxID=60893 RepID=A0A7V6A6G1_9BACT